MRDLADPAPRFIAPGVRPGPYTECYACGFPRRDHGPNGECPEEKDECPF